MEGASGSLARLHLGGSEGWNNHTSQNLSGTTSVPGPTTPSWHLSRTEGSRSATLVPVDDCETCTTAGVPSDGAIPWDVDATTAALIERVRAGRMIELRHDVPLEDMLMLLESELKYTISSFLECVDCGRVLFWGLCIRGNPILRCADRTEVDRWPWGPVPARARWARP